MSEKRFREKLSGRVRFPEDVTSKQIIHGGALRSPYPSGIIEEIKIPELPPDCYVIGYENIPGTKKMQLPQGEMPIIAHRHVSYLGEPLLLVGAPTRKQLRSLINSIEIRITPEPELSPISLDSRENIIYERHFNRGEAEDTLERDDLVLDEDFYSIAAQIPTTRSSPHVSCQREGNRYIIHSVNQWPSMVKKNTASVLKIRRDQIILRNYTTDNCQDSRLWSTILNSCYAALLCQASKRPVRFLLEDDWNALLTPRRGKVEFYVRGAQTTEGDLLALKIDFVQDVGAYGLLTPELIDRMVMAASGVYHCRHLEISGRGIRTNNPPSGVLPDFNLAPLFFAIESFVHNMARNCGISPFEWKEKNLIRRGNLFLGASTVPSNTNLSPLITRLMENSDYQRKEMSYQMLYEQKESISSNNESFQRGISYSLAYLGNDFLYNHTDLTTMTVRGVLNKEGELTLYLPVQPGMDRIKRVWANIATDILQLENKSLVSFSFDQERMNGGPSTAGRNIIHVTRLIELCCEQIQKKRFRDPLPLDVTRRYSRPESRWNSHDLSGIPYYNLSWGAAAVEVEVDQETFNLTIKNIWFVIDCGMIADEPSARITVERGLYLAMDSVFGTEWQKRESLPSFDIDFLSSGSSPRGLDGLIQSLFPPALSCAVNQALGYRGYSLPLEKGVIRD